MNTELKNKYSISQIFAAILVYFIALGYVFENYGQYTVKLTKILVILQHLNIIFFIFKKITIFIKFYIYKSFFKILNLLIIIIFKFIKFIDFIGIFNISFGFRFNFLRLKFVLLNFRRKLFNIEIYNIKIIFRLYLLFRYFLLIIKMIFKALRSTQVIFQWFFIKYLIKRQWIKGDTTLINLSHFVLHHYFLQFLVDLMFGTIEQIYCIFKRKRFSRSFHNYFFMYFAFIHISIYLFCLSFAFAGQYVKNLAFFSEAVMLNLGNSPNKNDLNAPKIPNKYLVLEEDLIDKNI